MEKRPPAKRAPGGQLAAAREVMARRRHALKELADRMDAAEAIMREDRDILQRLAGPF